MKKKTVNGSVVYIVYPMPSLYRHGIVLTYVCTFGDKGILTYIRLYFWGYFWGYLLGIPFGDTSVCTFGEKGILDMLQKLGFPEIICSTTHTFKDHLSMPFVHFSFLYTPMLQSLVFLCYFLLLAIFCSQFITCLLCFVSFIFYRKMSEPALLNHCRNEVEK